MRTMPTFLHRWLLGLALCGSLHGAEATNGPAAATNAPAGLATGTNGPAGDAKGSTNAAPAAPAAPADAAAGAAAGTNAPAGPAGRADFSAFRVIGDRNIFNPNRSARRAGGGEARRPARVDTVSLVGTLSYHKGDFAFFDGSSATFRKAVRTNETVADFRVTAVGTDEVTLEVNGKPVTVRVGARFRREEDGPWEVASTGTSVAASTDSSGSSNNTSSTGSDSGSTGAANDILARLRQKREQELKNENP